MKKIIKKIVSIVTAMAMVSSYAYVASAKSFPDVSTSHWAYDTINKLTDSGVFSGYDDGLFRPDNTITHEEFTTAVVTYVCDKLGQTVTPVSSDYVQVTTDDVNDPQFWTNRWATWAQPYLNKAVELGIIGDSNDTIRKDYDVAMQNKEDLPGVESPMQDAVRNVQVNVPITREEAARIVTRALFLTEPEIIEEDLESANPAARLTYGRPDFLPDWNDVFSAYRYDVLAMYYAGIMQGNEIYMFKPQNNLARSEATMLILKLTDSSLRPKDPFIEVLHPAAEEINKRVMDAASIFLSKEKPNRIDSADELFELCCREVIENSGETYPQTENNGDPIYRYTEERINKILETVQGTFCEELVTKLIDEIKAGKFWN